VAAATVVLVALGVLASVAGLLLSAVSSCCGSPDPADGTPLLVGLVVGVALVASGVVLWRGARPAATVLALAAAGPGACAVAASGSSDFQALLPVAVVAWLALAWLLRRSGPKRWLAR
jgi:hypothetical protein